MENKTPKKMSKATMFQLLLLALVLAVGVFAYYKYGNVAIVNGKAISRLSYIDLMEKQVGKQTLDQMVTEALILGAAEKQNITVPESEINASLSEVEAQVKALGEMPTALVNIATALAEKNVKIVPDNLVIGGGGAVDGLAGILMNYFSKMTGKVPEKQEEPPKKAEEPPKKQIKG